MNRSEPRFVLPSKIEHYLASLSILSEVLPEIERLSTVQAEQVIVAYRENYELRGSFGFNGGRPVHYGDGLAAHLSRMTGREYLMTSSGEVERKAK